jgi:hypothetical protein
LGLGFYGGSLAYSPYDKPYKRTIYKHEGNLYTIQTFELPVKSFNDSQRGIVDNNLDGEMKFKNPPPGFSYNGINKSRKKRNKDL